MASETDYHRRLRWNAAIVYLFAIGCAFAVYVWADRVDDRIKRDQRIDCQRLLILTANQKIVLDTLSAMEPSRRREFSRRAELADQVGRPCL